MSKTIAVIPGDGIGPEIMDATIRVLDALDCGLTYDYVDAGVVALEKHGDLLPQATLEAIEKHKVALKGPVTTPIGGGFSSINVTLRKQFELYANFRPIKNLPGLETKYPGVDMVIVRENTEGLYVGLEHEVVPGVVESLKIITAKASTRIAKWAFEYVRRQKRRKIHAIHKANI